LLPAKDEARVKLQRGNVEATDKRHIRESGVEARIAAIAEPVADGLGFRIVRVRVTGERGCTVQIMAERPDGEFSIADCEALSHDLSPVLDLEDPISTEYHLEVSSPGVDRPLVRLVDFERYVGHDAKIELHAMIDGRRRFRGFLEPVEGNEVGIRLPDAPDGTDPVFRFPITEIAEAKLVLTDRLLDEAARRQREADPLEDPEIETETDTETDSDEDAGA
jgi:ribosome maturation factor RimP